MNAPVEGIYAAVFTPFHEDYSIHWRRIDPYIEKLKQSGVAGIFVNGTTGEFASLSVDERMRLAEAWKNAAGDHLRMIVHVGGTCLAECQALSRHAQAIGADGISAVPPYYFKPADWDELIRFSEQTAAAAPELPFYYYHIPSLTGVSYSMTTYLQHALERIPNLSGVKYSHPDLTDVHGCLNRTGKPCTVFFGVDEMLLGAMAMGVKAAVGSTYNFAMPIYQKIISAFEAGDLELARRHQTYITGMVRVMQRYGGLSALKALMNLSVMDCGPFRPPVKTLYPHESNSLEDELKETGYFEHI